MCLVPDIFIDYIFEILFVRHRYNINAGYLSPIDISA